MAISVALNITDPLQKKGSRKIADSKEKDSKKNTSSYLQDFAAGMDPLGAFTNSYGRRNQEANISESEHTKKQMLGATGGLIGGGLALPSLVSGVSGAIGGVGEGKGVKGKALSGAKGFLEGARKPFKGLKSISDSKGAIQRAISEGGTQVSGKEIDAMRYLGGNTPLKSLSGKAEETAENSGGVIDKVKSFMGNGGAEKVKDTNKVIQEGELSKDLAESLKDPIDTTSSKIYGQLGIGAGVGAGGATFQYNAGRDTAKMYNDKEGRFSELNTIDPLQKRGNRETISSKINAFNGLQNFTEKYGPLKKAKGNWQMNANLDDPYEAGVYSKRSGEDNFAATTAEGTGSAAASGAALGAVTQSTTGKPFSKATWETVKGGPSNVNKNSKKVLKEIKDYVGKDSGIAQGVGKTTKGVAKGKNFNKALSEGAEKVNWSKVLPNTARGAIGGALTGAAGMLAINSGSYGMGHLLGNKKEGEHTDHKNEEREEKNAAFPSKLVPKTPQQAIAAGAGIGALGGGALSYLRQKSDMYSGNTERNRVNPYDIVESSLVAGGLGGVGGLGVRNADRLAQGAKDVLNEVRAVSRSVQDMGQVAKNAEGVAEDVGGAARTLDELGQKAKNNRAYGIFSKQGMRGNHIDTRDSVEGSKKEASSQKGSQISLRDALRHIGKDHEKLSSIRRNMSKSNNESLSKTAGLQKNAIGFPSLKTLGVGAGVAGAGAAAGYGAGNYDGFNDAEESTEEKVEENFTPYKKTIRTPSGPREQVFWARPTGKAEKTSNIGKSISKAFPSPSKSNIMKGLGIGGVGLGAGVAGYAAGDQAGKERYNKHLDNNYMHGTTTMNTNRGPMRMQMITKKINEGGPVQEKARRKHASSISPLNFSAKSRTIDMKEDRLFSNKKRGRRSEKKAFGFGDMSNTIFSFGGNPTNGNSAFEGQGGTKGQSAQPMLPDKKIRQDTSAKSDKPKEIENKIDDMSS